MYLQRCVASVRLTAALTAPKQEQGSGVVRLKIPNSHVAVEQFT